MFTGCPDEDEPGTADSGVVEVRDASLPDATPNDAGLPAAEVCPRGAGEVILGDTNGDGVLDLADSIALQNALFRGGRAVVCRPASDWNNDGRVEMDDAARISTYLVTGYQPTRTVPANACDSATYWPDGQCAPLAFDIHAPEKAVDTRFEATVAIRSPTLAVQGWSYSLRADGCRITGATTLNTTAAEVWDTPPGIRHLGYEATLALSEDRGAISYVNLSSVEDISLPVQLDGSPVGVFQIEAETPATGCRECRLSLGDGLSWIGQAIDAMIVAGGYAYRPEPPAAVVQVCAE